MTNIDAGPWGGIWEALLAEGPLGRRILRALDNEGSASRIREVYRDLAQCLDEGTMFREAVAHPSRAAYAVEVEPTCR